MRFVVVAMIGLGFASGCGDDAASGDGGMSMPSAGNAPASAGSGGMQAAAVDSGVAAQGAGSAGDAGCAEPASNLDASYTQQSGECGPISNPFRVPLGSSATGSSIMVQNFAGARVETEVVISGCSLSVTQTVSSPDLHVRIEAEGLVIDAAGGASGLATVTRYDADGATVCSGVYAIELRPAGSVAPDAGSAGSGGGGSLVTPALEAALMQSCQQTLQCAEQRGSELPIDPLTTCIVNTKAQVTTSQESVDAFLELHTRCNVFVVCDYVNCTLTQRE